MESKLNSSSSQLYDLNSARSWNRWNKYEEGDLDERRRPVVETARSSDAEMYYKITN
jgi:hypothetical protein